MARRKKSAGDNGCAVAGVAVIVVVGLVVKLVAAHPVASLVGGTAVIGLTIWGIVLWRRKRAREARQAWELEVARSQEIARYHSMAPDEFERALAFLCSRDGCSQATVTGRAGDLGADVTAYAPDGRKIVLQAKRYGGTSKVTGPDLQRFGGTCYSVHGARVAAVVTTSTFTKQAREYAAHHGIRLLDGPGLAAWAGRTGPAPWH
ncbi:restriction endonuclease [Amycolatopsis sp. SID8362]|uniref:restriction endonuclease n=1 Tax=Amycolatopsis sp. SID8362 TaxID=2690346 RepID=UPI0013722646|nr:restriction endonuclease [Amycolatopsis sp. SID8362]NBH02700.1 restriction endonuclease [Amycolatopsis sp. SID8362]NED39402.1 restriction endonuclease [Amycolatopsis sp. SID8362]